MPRFRTFWQIADTLPDSRLVQARWTPVPNGIRSDHLFLARHVHPTLLRELDEFCRHLAHSNLYVLQPELAATPPEFRVHYERVDPDRLPLRTFGIRISRDRKDYTFCVRADMMSAALVREINTDFLPAQQGALRLRGSAPETAEPIDLEVLGAFSGQHRTVYWVAGPADAPNAPISPTVA
ncbi:hypothetical protein RB628_09635 [Streptomyces sp. ADMS]|uniref:hypothetical protein n=1 Tax=Streptomyces sp. ADMS TaxID=3071415 RepID=UPI00296E864E|nr:hypothetical protein [Streptomyces sp. ADMS]MDW4905600.1 hypothetical protein [Streptomyces sp. ADMS]